MRDVTSVNLIKCVRRLESIMNIPVFHSQTMTFYVWDFSTWMDMWQQHFVGNCYTMKWKKPDIILLALSCVMVPRKTFPEVKKKVVGWGFISCWQALSGAAPQTDWRTDRQADGRPETETYRMGHCSQTLTHISAWLPQLWKPIITIQCVEPDGTVWTHTHSPTLLNMSSLSLTTHHKHFATPAITSAK